MKDCTYFHEKMIYEENKLKELCPENMPMEDFILSNRGRELCGYCINICPDRLNCEKYNKSAKH